MASPVDGRLLARNGGVTLINDTVTRAACAPGTEPTATSPGSGTDTAPGAIPAPRVLDVRPVQARRGRPGHLGRGRHDQHARAGQRDERAGRQRPRRVRRQRVPARLTPGGTSREPSGRARGRAWPSPLRFSRTGPQKVLVRVDSGGCSSAPTSVYQTVTVTPTRRRRAPAPAWSSARRREEKPRGTLLPPLLPAGLDPRPRAARPARPGRRDRPSREGLPWRGQAPRDLAQLAASSRAAPCSACSTRPAAPTG